MSRQKKRAEVPRASFCFCFWREKRTGEFFCFREETRKKKNNKNFQNSLECWSHIIMLTRIVSTLQTFPMTENDVAEITALSANEK